MKKRFRTSIGPKDLVVTPTSGDTFNAVLLTGDLPIDQTLTTPPYKFSITIPPKATTSSLD